MLRLEGYGKPYNRDKDKGKKTRTMNTKQEKNEQVVYYPVRVRVSTL